MWIVRVALDRPYTFVVLALLILILSPVIILRTPTDIFPNINIPVIAAAWQYSGMNTRSTFCSRAQAQSSVSLP
jgi:multidrug efflux pump subunit AcrB